MRYLTLKGCKGVTLVDDQYRPTTASADRQDRIHGVAWAPAGATDPAATPRPASASGRHGAPATSSAGSFWHPTVGS